MVAIGLLAQNQDEETVEVLLQALDDEEFMIQDKAMEYLGSIGDERICKRLLPYIEDKSSRLRVSALQALGNIPTKDSLQLLSGIILDENENRDNRKLALEALQFCKDEGCEEFLFSVVKGEHASWYKEIAIILLGESKNSKYSKEFLKLLTFPSNEFYYGPIIYAVAKIGDDRAVMPLSRMLGSKSYSATIKNEIIQALGRLADIRAVEPIICVLDESTDHIKAVTSAIELILGSDAIGDFMNAHPAEKGSKLAVGYEILKEDQLRKQTLLMGLGKS